MTFPFKFETDKNEKKDAFRIALQSAAAAIVAFVIMKSSGLPEVFLCVLSAVLIVEPSIGNTISQAKDRVVATLVGSGIGFGLSALIPFNIGTAISLGIAMFVINFIAGFKKSWRYGVVAAVAIALGSENNLLDTTLDRLIAIGVGVVIGTLITFIIWPDRAEDRADRFLRLALVSANKRFNVAVNNTRHEEKEDGSDHGDSFRKNINYAQDMINAAEFADKSKIQECIRHAKNLYNSIIIIHRVGEESSRNVTDGNSNIEKDAENVKALASDIIEAIAAKDKIEQHTIKKFTDGIDKVISNVSIDDEDKSITMLRQTFVFGLNEMKQSIEALAECDKNT